MSKKPLFWEMFLFVLCMGVLNAIAMHFFLYWKLNEFDSLVHFSGGAAVSATILWLYFYSPFFKPVNRGLKSFILVSVLGIIAVGFIWEIFEIVIDATSVTDPKYSYDTTLDIIMDTLGALAACLYGYLRELESKKAQVESYEQS